MRLEDTDIQSQVGSVVTYVAPEPIGAAVFRYFAQAIGDPFEVRYEGSGDPLEHSEELIAPPTLIFETNQDTNRGPDHNGFTGHCWDGIPHGAVWIRGGNEYRIGRPVVPDDVLHVTWTLIDARTITTRDGRLMVQITSEANFKSQDGDWLGWNREDMFIADPVT